MTIWFYLLALDCSNVSYNLESPYTVLLTPYDMVNDMIWLIHSAGVPGQSNESQDNTSGVVVGAIFASAGALLLVLAGWFVLKKVW